VCVVWLEKGVIEQWVEAMVSGMDGMRQGSLELLGGRGEANDRIGDVEEKDWGCCSQLYGTGGHREMDWGA
jgi:hypothetical protein